MCRIRKAVKPLTAVQKLPKDTPGTWGMSLSVRAESDQRRAKGVNYRATSVAEGDLARKTFTPLEPPEDATGELRLSYHLLLTGARNLYCLCVGFAAALALLTAVLSTRQLRLTRRAVQERRTRDLGKFSGSGAYDSSILI